MDSSTGRGRVAERPSADPTSRGEIVTREGVVLRVRPISDADREALRDAFEKLSAESRYRRFLTPVQRLSAAQVDAFTRVDHDCQEALVALDPEGEIVGVARFVRVAADSDTAEVAVTIADEWQHCGIGTALLHRLAERAEDLGIERFVATCLMANNDMLQLLRDVGISFTRTGASCGAIEVEVELPTKVSREHLSRAVRLVAAAHGQLIPINH